MVKCSSIEEIRKLSRQETDKWVLKAVTKNIGEYPPEIQAVIREEALRRGLIEYKDIEDSQKSLEAKASVCERKRANMKAERQIKTGCWTAVVFVFLLLLAPWLRVIQGKDLYGLREAYGTFLYIGIHYLGYSPSIILLTIFAYAVRKHKVKTTIIVFIIHTVWWFSLFFYSILARVENFSLTWLIIPLIGIFLLTEGVSGVCKKVKRTSGEKHE